MCPNFFSSENKDRLKHVLPALHLFSICIHSPTVPKLVFLGSLYVVTIFSCKYVGVVSSCVLQVFHPRHLLLPHPVCDNFHHGHGCSCSPDAFQGTFWTKCKLSSTEIIFRKLIVYCYTGIASRGNHRQYDHQDHHDHQEHHDHDHLHHGEGAWLAAPACLLDGNLLFLSIPTGV